jgi:hypothetical protein
MDAAINAVAEISDNSFSFITVPPGLLVGLSQI